jgi:hypothetical protein
VAVITIDLPFVLCDNNCFVYVAIILFIFYKKIERPIIVLESSRDAAPISAAVGNG